MSNGTRRKLPVFATVGAAYRRTRDDFPDYALLAAPLFLLSLFGNYLQMSRMADSMKRGDLASMQFDPLMIPIQIASIALYVMLFTSVVRRTLLGANGPRNALGLGWGWRETRIVGRGLLIVLILTLIAAPLLVLAFWLARGEQPSALFAFVPLITFIITIFVYCRSTTYLTAPSLDADLEFRAAFRSTRGNVLRIFACFLLTALPFLIGMMVIVAVLGSPAKLMLEGKSVLLSLPVLNAIGVVLVVLDFVLVAMIYEQLVQVPAAEGGAGSPSGTRLPEAGGY